MNDHVADQKSTHGGPGADGAGGGGATGHGGAGALMGPSSSGFDSGKAWRTDRAWDDAGSHLTDQSGEERASMAAAADEEHRAPDEFLGDDEPDEFHGSDESDDDRADAAGGADASGGGA